MVASVSPVGMPGVTSVGPKSQPVSERANQATGVDSPAKSGFGQAVGQALGEVSATTVAAEQAAEAAAVGDLKSVSDYMIAATEAQLATEITVAVRDRAISAFNDIMRMQI